MTSTSPGFVAIKEPLCTRPVDPADYKEISRIYCATFPEMDDKDFATAWFDRCPQSSIALFQGKTEKLIGFGLVTDSTCAIAAEKKLWFLAVDASFRSGGSGSYLLKAIMATTPSLCLAPVNDEKIIAWYQKNGFEIVQRYPFVHEDIPTCLMSWESSSRSSDDEKTIICSGNGSPVSVYSERASICSDFSLDCQVLYF